VREGIVPSRCGVRGITLRKILRKYIQNPAI